MSGLVDLWQAFRAGAVPDDPMGVAEWADRHRYLPSTSAESGLWRTERTPYLRAIMDALSEDDPCQTVVVMAGSQLGKSESGNNWIGWIIDCCPGPALMVQPRVEDAENYSKERIASMILASPRLSEKVAKPRARDSDNTLLRKQFPGGFLRIVGSNAPSGLASTPVRFLFLDEVDRFPEDSGGEGDPVALARQRTATFANRKVLLTSTPTIEGFSRIDKAYAETDRRRYWVPCPHCEQMQVLRWKPDDEHPGGVVWPPGRPSEAKYQCEHCGVLIENHEKNWMLPRGEWRADVPGNGLAVGFWISSLYSPHGWVSWADLAQEFTDAGRDPERLKPFFNTKLAETWKPGLDSEVRAAGLAARAEVYGCDVPRGVQYLTAGVDVQDDRIELEVVGWGAGEESWSIAWMMLPGDPSGPAVWRDLDQVLRRDWSSPDGARRILATCVDSGGHHTLAVYRYCRERTNRKVWAIKGRAGQHILWPKRPSYKTKNGTPLYLIGVDSAKEAIMARLRITGSGPGAMHFPTSHGPEYYEQLTAERIVTSRYRGRETRKWVKPSGKRNEALDCRVYAMAALHGLFALNYRLAKLPDPASGVLAAQVPLPLDDGPTVAPPAAPAAPAPTPPRPAPKAPAKPKRSSMWDEFRGRE